MVPLWPPVEIGQEGLIDHIIRISGKTGPFTKTTQKDIDECMEALLVRDAIALEMENKMRFELHERRTKTRIIDCKGADEDQCYLCSAHNAVNQLEPLKPSVNGLTDDRGNAMMEHRVSCAACGEKWVDVFCRIYPDPVKPQDEQDGMQCRWHAQL